MIEKQKKWVAFQCIILGFGILIFLLLPDAQAGRKVPLDERVRIDLDDVRFSNFNEKSGANLPVSAYFVGKGRIVTGQSVRYYDSLSVSVLEHPQSPAGPHGIIECYHGAQTHLLNDEKPKMKLTVVGRKFQIYSYSYGGTMNAYVHILSGVTRHSKQINCQVIAKN